MEVNQALMALDGQNYQYPLAAAQALVRMERPQDALVYAQQALALAPEEQKPPIEQLVSQLSGS